MTQRTAVLVTGSRDWTDYEPIRERLRFYPPGAIVIHGGCGKRRRSEGYAKYLRDAKGQIMLKGADWIAGAITRELGQLAWALPFFGDLGERGGPVRNDTMIDILSVLWRRDFRCAVEGFPIGDSFGTRGCLRLAESRCKFLGADWSFTVTEGQ